MMKKTAAAVVVLVVLVLGYASTKPDAFRVSRSVSVNASPARIFPLLEDLHAQNAWSPWEKKDPAMKRTFSGAAKGVGSVYEWDGNKDIGAGRLAIVEVVPLKKVVMSLDFIRPMEGHNTAEFSLEPKGGATEVTWSFSGPSPLVSKVMCLFMDMDEMVGKDFEAGLADLKALAEKR